MGLISSQSAAFPSALILRFEMRGSLPPSGTLPKREGGQMILETFDWMRLIGTGPYELESVE